MNQDKIAKALGTNRRVNLDFISMGLPLPQLKQFIMDKEIYKQKKEDVEQYKEITNEENN